MFESLLALKAVVSEVETKSRRQKKKNWKIFTPRKNLLSSFFLKPFTHSLEIMFTSTFSKVVALTLVASSVAQFNSTAPACLTTCFTVKVSLKLLYNDFFFSTLIFNIILFHL